MRGLIYCLGFFMIGTLGAQTLGERWRSLIADTVALDTHQVRPDYFILVPVLRYLPETRWSLVLAGNYIFRPRKSTPGTRPSNVRLSASITQNHQYIFRPHFEIFTPDNRWFLKGGVTWTRFPELYYGVGNHQPLEQEEMYSFDLFRLYGRVMKRHGKNLYWGGHWTLENMYRMRYPEASLLFKEPVTGNTGGLASGPGAIAIWDNRKNIYFPANGVYAEFQFSIYNKLTGSDFQFTSWTLDLRKYISLRSNKDVLAFQAYGQFNPGDPPFRMMGLLGGENTGRGYYQGRFRDRHHMSTQLEYRMKVWKRVGVTVFAGMATVFKDHPDRKPFPFWGIGFRGKLLRKEYLNVRLDIGFTPEGPNYYFTLDEAY